MRCAITAKGGSMKKSFLRTTILGLVLAFGLNATVMVPQANAGLVLMLTAHSRVQENRGAGDGGALLGLILFIVGVADHTTWLWVLPAPQASMQVAVSEALPFLSATDNAQISNLLEQKVIRGEVSVTTLVGPQGQALLEANLDKDQVLSVLNDSDYTQEQLNQALAALN